MKKYQLTVYQPDGDSPPPDVLDPIMDQLDALNRGMQAAGVWVFAAALHPPEIAKVIHYRDDEVLVTDGPCRKQRAHRWIHHDPGAGLRNRAPVGGPARPDTDPADRGPSCDG